MSRERDPYEPLWITRLARATGTDRLAGRFGRPDLGPYAFVSILLVVDGVVLSTVGHLVAGRPHPLLEDPFWYTAPVGLWFAIWSVRSLARTYVTISSTYDFGRRFAAADVTAESFYDVRTTRIKHGLFALLLAIHATNYVILGGWVQVARTAGPAIGFVKFGLIIPFGYFPVIAEAGGLVLASLVVVPRYVIAKEYRLQFDDPLDTGGLEPVGDLIKQSVYIYTFGLVLGLLFEYGPELYTRYAGASGLDPALTSPPLALQTPEFFALWGLGIALMLYAVLKLHAYMQRQKRRKIEALDARLRELGSDDRGFPETELDAPEHPRVEFEYLRLQKVKDTSTFPFTPAAEERIVVSALAPVVLDVAIGALL